MLNFRDDLKRFNDAISELVYNVDMKRRVNGRFPSHFTILQEKNHD